MPYVERNDGDEIIGLYENLQSGYAEEFLGEGHTDVVAFRADVAARISPTVPAISKAQLLLYLLPIGKTEADVDAAIAAIPDATQRAVAEIEWKYRQPFHHSHPLIIAMAPALGVSDIPAAFAEAASL